MRASLCLLALTGCSLYFGEPPPIDREIRPDACGTAPPDAKVCPAVGTLAEISYPVDGATNVPSPVPIRWRTVIPNTLDGRGIFLSDASNQVVPLDQWDASCSSSTYIKDDWVVSCYDLAPNSVYTWHIWITCYDASGIHEIATSTFRTAP